MGCYVKLLAFQENKQVYSGFLSHYLGAVNERMPLQIDSWVHVIRDCCSGASSNKSPEMSQFHWVPAAVCLRTGMGSSRPPLLSLVSIFTFQKKRKQRKRDADSLSLCSLDINVSTNCQLTHSAPYSCPPVCLFQPACNSRLPKPKPVYFLSVCFVFQ